MPTEYRYSGLSLCSTSSSPTFPELRVRVGKLDKLASIKLTENELLEIAEKAITAYRTYRRLKAEGRIQ